VSLADLSRCRLALWSAFCDNLRRWTTVNSLMEYRSPRRWCHRVATHADMLQCISQVGVITMAFNQYQLGCRLQGDSQAKCSRRTRLDEVLRRDAWYACAKDRGVDILRHLPNQLVATTSASVTTGPKQCSA
jgi:hypothetical protein